jgi:hypothetical protein
MWSRDKEAEKNRVLENTRLHREKVEARKAEKNQNS